MSLSRTNSRSNLTANNISSDKNPGPASESQEKAMHLEAISSSGSVIQESTSEQALQKKEPKMKLQLQQENDSTKKNEFNLSPRKIPKSPRLLKSKNSGLMENLSPRKDLNSLQTESSDASNQITESSVDTASITEPVIQVRRITIKASKLFNENTDTSATTSATSPRITNLPSSASLNEALTSSQESTTSHEACSAALLYLIFKKYETETLTSGNVSAFGRDDIYFAVKTIPRILSDFTEFPDNGITSLSELLIAIFGDELKNSTAWKAVNNSIQEGMSVDDGTVIFGETDTLVKDKYTALLKPYALKISESIFGTGNDLNASALPTNLINCILDGDKKLLTTCLTSKKLKTKEINNARVHFLFNMAVTRFAQVLIMKKFSDNPSQVESWFASTIIKALGEKIKALSENYLDYSNKRISEELRKKFFEKVAAETREDEAIKQFKLNELKKNRINELQIKALDYSNKYEQGRGHRRVNSHTTLVSVKLERNFNKKLDEIKTQCGFYEMEPEFLKFINKNQNISFDSDIKVSVSNIILNLKLAVREYDQMTRKGVSEKNEKIENLIKNLDFLFEHEFNAQQKRRSTAFSKKINFSEKQNKILNSSDGQNAATPTAINAPSDTSLPISSLLNTTADQPAQLNESSSEEK